MAEEKKSKRKSGKENTGGVDYLGEVHGPPRQNLKNPE